METHSKTVEQLLAAGILAQDYKRGPAGPDAFAISIQGTAPQGIVYVHEGNAKIKVAIDPKFRQAVMHVHEQPRKFTRKVIARIMHSGREQRPSKQRQEDYLRLAFPIDVPGRPEWTYKGRKCEWINLLRYGYHWRISAEVTAKIVVDTKHDFLVGMDEVHHFVAALPKRVKSVCEAHEVLKPDGLTEKSVRQGEWFFTPVAEKLAKKIDGWIKQQRIRYGGNVRLLAVRRLEKGSHTCKQWMRMNGKDYAKGYVMDRRSYRHDPLFLDGWHRIDRNKEVVVHTERRTRTWD